MTKKKSRLIFAANKLVKCSVSHAVCIGLYFSIGTRIGENTVLEAVTRNNGNKLSNEFG